MTVWPGVGTDRVADEETELVDDDADETAELLVCTTDEDWDTEVFDEDTDEDVLEL